MQKPKLTLAALTLAAALPMLQGCFPAIVAGGAAAVATVHDRRTTGTQTDDESTEWKANGRIPAEYREAAHANFTSFNRRVLITGEAPNEEAKAAIERGVRQIEGVREVYNELAVGPASSFGSRSNDTYIDSKVKARLVDEKQVSAHHVKVVTERGIVYLMGILNDKEAQVAVTIARTTSGVRKVVNLTEVLPADEVRRIDEQGFGARKAQSATSAPVESR